MRRVNLVFTHPIRKSLALLLCLAMVPLVSACSSAAENAARAGLEAQQKLDAGDLFGARKAIAEALSERDDDPNLHILKGRIELASGQPASAFAAYSDALSLEATNPEALQAVSQLGLQTGYLRQADQAADTILSFSPDQPEAMLIKGLISLVRRKREDALKYAEGILEVRPNDEAGTILKARIFALTGKSDEALEMLQNSASDENYSEGVDLTLIELFRNRGDAEQMRATFTRLLNKRPNDLGLKIDFANTLYKTEDPESARSLIRSMLREKPTNNRILAMMTDLWLEYDTEPLTETDINFLAADGSLESRVAIARYLLLTDRPDDARKILTKVASGFWVDARALYARSLRALGRGDEALEMANAILDADETNAHALLVRADAALARQDYVQAINDAQIVIRDNPRMVDGYLALTDIYRAKNDHVSATRVFEDGIEKLPQNRLLFEAFGDFLTGIGNFRRAVAATRQFTRDTPASIRAWQLYGEMCDRANAIACEMKAKQGAEVAKTIFAIDLPPGSPPTRGLFGRLN